MPTRHEVIASEITDVLLGHILVAKNEMTYGDLSKAILDKYDDQVPAWHGLGRPLGIIQDACKELGLPNLSVMVVDQKTLRPAKGWYDYFDELFPELADLDPVEKRNKARDEVLACNDWAALYNFFGLESAEQLMQVDPIVQQRLYIEGASELAEKTRKELKRSFDARRRAIDIHGTTCSICGFNSEELYGIPGIIEVHHLRPLADGGERNTDPEIDLMPVCPNCHRIIHSKRDGIFTPEEVRKMLGVD